MRFVSQKSGPGSYRIGQFHVHKVKSRWRVVGAAHRTFSTLGGARAWCLHQSNGTPAPRSTELFPRRPAA